MEQINFYLRRLFRIAPLFWLSMAFYWIFPQVLPPGWYKGLSPEGVHFSYFLVTGLFLHGWHPCIINSIVPGGWSIADEMMFYLVFPLCFHRIVTLRKAAFCVMCGTAFSVAEVFFMNRFGWHLWSRGTESLAVSWFIQLWFPTQFVVFLIGIFAYLLLKEPIVHKLYASRFWSCWVLAISALIIFRVALYAPYGPITVVLVVFALVGGVISVAGNSLPWMVNPFLCRLGEISYSCYLTHFAALGIVLQVLEAKFPRYALNLPGEFVVSTGHNLSNLGIFAVIWVASLILTIVLSTVTHHLVEKPGIALGKIVIRKLNQQGLSPEQRTA